MNEALRQQLLALAEQEQSFLGSRSHTDDRDSDEAQRQLLELMGRLTQRMVDILDTYGWPGKSLAARTANRRPGRWPCTPCTTRRATSLPAAAKSRRCSWGGRTVAGAFLVDRVALVERNAQEYGTTICRQEDGGFGPPLREDPEHVDERRRAVGLPPWNTTSAGSKRTTAAPASSSVRSPHRRYQLIRSCNMTNWPSSSQTCPTDSRSVASRAFRPWERNHLPLVSEQSARRQLR